MLFRRFCFFLLSSFSILGAEECKQCKGKIDIAPTYLSLDFKESNKTVDHYDLYGLRFGIDYFLWKALLFRGTALGAWNDADFQIYTAGLGACLPFKKLYFTPSAGATWSRFSSYIDVPSFGLYNLKNTFRSLGPYVGLDVQWCISESFRIGGSFQYSWSHTHSQIKGLFKTKDNSMGPTWSFLIEKDLSKKWSINLGGAINRSLNHEKHGIKGQGVKLGITYWL
jgi:hypothetical protein